MDKVIILKGASDKGKTPTLHILIDLLISRHGASVVLEENYSGNITTDCFVILEIPDFGRVGVITYGDNGCQPAVQNALAECLNNNCVAVVGASHMQYNRSPMTVYKILWDFGRIHNAKTVETTTIIKDDNFGQKLIETHINTICAENLCSLLFKL